MVAFSIYSSIETLVFRVLYTYDYDKNDLVEKSFMGADGEESAQPVVYVYNTLGERVAMNDSTSNTAYAYEYNLIRNRTTIVKQMKTE